jgi:hypothetical protein
MASDLRKITNISHRQTFIKNYLNPALELGLIEMTQPARKIVRHK